MFEGKIASFLARCACQVCFARSQSGPAFLQDFHFEVLCVRKTCDLVLIVFASFLFWHNLFRTRTAAPITTCREMSLTLSGPGSNKSAGAGQITNIDNNKSKRQRRFELLPPPENAILTTLFAAHDMALLRIWALIPLETWQMSMIIRLTTSALWLRVRYTNPQIVESALLPTV